MQPLWVFRKTCPEATLGLLIDISPDGAQILTGKEETLQEIAYRLVIHTEAEQEALIIDAFCCWSRPDGTLYSSNGLVFAEKASLQAIVPALESGGRWLRCELVPLTSAAKLRMCKDVEGVSAA
ncbi:MAG: hypothetical protein J0653_04875 [Deltaproteobacteria bacterium]|nr:hypothetical protein [Deltaproteobacteria bacterium]